MANQVYDPETEDQSKPGSPNLGAGHDKPSGDSSDPRGDLRSAEGDGGGFYNSSGDKGSASASDLKDAEGSSDNEEEDQDKLGKGYSDSATRRRRVKITRRQAAGGGIAGLLIALILGGGSIVQGPLEFVHIAQMLDRFHFSANHDLEDGRLAKIARFINSPDKLERTRLGFVGNAVADKLEARMKENGIESSYSDKLRYGDGYTIDGNHEKYKDVSKDRTKFKERVAKEYGVDPSDLISFQTDKGHFVRINTEKMGFIAQSKLARVVLKNTDLGTISSTAGARIMGKRAAVTWHPIQKADQAILQTLVDATKANRDKAKAKQQAEFDKQQIDSIKEGDFTITGDPKVDPEADGNTDPTKVDDANKTSTAVKDFMEHPTVKITGGGVAVVGAACVAKGLSDSVVQLRQTQVVLPMIRMGVQAMSLGSQVMSGQDISAEQLGLFKEQLDTVNSKGKVTSTWNEAESIQAEEGNENTGKPIPKSANVFGKSNPFNFINSVPGIGSVCNAANSTIGQGVGLAFSGGPLGAAFSLAAGKALETTGVMESIAQWAAGKAINPLATGADRGNFMNYGARLAANDQAVAAGGTELSNSQEVALKSATSALDETDFQSHGLAYRLFNTNDSRSLVSRLIDKQDPNVAQNVDQVATGFTGVFSSALKVPGTLFSSIAHAAPKPYDYGFSKYGFSVEDQENPSVEDPFKNGNKAADLLDADKQSGGKLKAKAEKCFNVSIDDSSGQWDVSGGDSTTNLYNDAYAGNDCNDNSSDWRTIRFFILDTETIESYDCYQSDTPTSDDSCNNIGFGDSQQSSDTGDSGPVAPGTLPSGSSQDLAKQLLPYISSGKIKCNSQAANCPDIQKTAKGDSIKGASCNVESLNPQLLGLFLYLVQQGHTFILSAICSDHPTNPGSNHHTGKAADFNIIDGVFMGPSATAPWDQKKKAAAEKLDKDAASVLPKGSEFGQQQCGQNDFSFLSGFRRFNDGCHHQHIGVKG